MIESMKCIPLVDWQTWMRLGDRETLVEGMDGNLTVSKLDEGNVLAIVLPTQLQRN